MTKTWLVDGVYMGSDRQEQGQDPTGRNLLQELRELVYHLLRDTDAELQLQQRPYLKSRLCGVNIWAGPPKMAIIELIARSPFATRIVYLPRFRAAMDRACKQVTSKLRVDANAQAGPAHAALATLQRWFAAGYVIRHVDGNITGIVETRGATFVGVFVTRGRERRYLFKYHPRSQSWTSSNPAARIDMEPEAKRYAVWSTPPPLERCGA